MWKILQGDWIERLRELPDESVHCVVTSPPYWGLRDYGVPGQLGLERTPEEYVAKMVEGFREVRRVLRSDGTLWLNLGDSYASDSKGSGGPSEKQLSNAGSLYEVRRLEHGAKPKDLCGIPWMVAFALRSDGWWLRQDIIWVKPNPMPESVTDRCTKAHEYMFLMTKSERYFYDAEAVKEPVAFPEMTHRSTATSDAQESAYFGNAPTNLGRCGTDPSGRNRRSVWSIATAPFPEAHFATFPPKLVEPCILAGTSERGCCPECDAPWERVVETTGEWRAQHDRSAKYNGEIYRTNPGGGIAGENTSRETRTIGWQPTCKCNAGEPVPATVLDPFSGAGTTGMVARRLGRYFVGIELNPEYVGMSETRIRQDAPLFN